MNLESRVVFLRYPLYQLYHLDDIVNFQGLTEEEVDSFNKEYDATLRYGIIEALKWLSDHPSEDLTEILPDLPCSNEEIHRFANKVLRSLEGSK